MNKKLARALVSKHICIIFVNIFYWICTEITRRLPDKTTVQVELRRYLYKRDYSQTPCGIQVI